MVDVSRTALFMGAGTGTGAVFYYRMMLPATELKCSYLSVYPGDWPNVVLATGLIQDRNGGPPQTAKPDLRNYSVIILQQPNGDSWLKLIKSLRKAGKVVLYEIDDYIHGIYDKADHDFQRHYSPQKLLEYERCMRECDGMICSTDYLARHYAKFNPRTFVCYNGLDLGRYNLSRPPRNTVNIGWAGGSGHIEAGLSWLQAVNGIMHEFPNTCFVSVGEAFANVLKHTYGKRALSIPWAAMEQYPAAMRMIDIALAPALGGSWYLGKSDLRFLEAGALGIPIVADPRVYGTIEDGVTGFFASSPSDALSLLRQLVQESELRERVGSAAREYVETERSIAVAAEQWRKVIQEVAPTNS